VYEAKVEGGKKKTFFKGRRSIFHSSLFFLSFLILILLLLLHLPYLHTQTTTTNVNYIRMKYYIGDLSYVITNDVFKTLSKKKGADGHVISGRLPDGAAYRYVEVDNGSYSDKNGFNYSVRRRNIGYIQFTKMLRDKLILDFGEEEVNVQLEDEWKENPSEDSDDDDEDSDDEDSEDYDDDDDDSEDEEEQKKKRMKRKKKFVLDEDDDEDDEEKEEKEEKKKEKEKEKKKDNGQIINRVTTSFRIVNMDDDDNNMVVTLFKDLLNELRAIIFGKVKVYLL